MNLEELLDHTAKEYLDDRTDLVDGDSDSLWSDEVLVRYFNDAQRRLCRRAWVLTDTGNPTAGVITLATGKFRYALHSSVVRVLEATVEGEETPLARHVERELVTGRPYDPPGFEDINGLTATSPGSTIAYATDAGTRMFRVWRTPAAAQNGQRILLKVTRMPVCMLTVDDTGASPEVPEEWHLSLAKYAAGRCLLHPTADSEGRAIGRELLAEFERDVHEARQERERAERAEPRFVFASTTARL